LTLSVRDRLGSAPRLRWMLLAFLLVMFAPPGAAHADVTDGGGSADFVFKTIVSGQTGPPPQDVDYGSSWSFIGNPIGGVLEQTPATMQLGTQFHVGGIGTDGNFYDDIYDGPSGTWGGWQPIGAPSGAAPFTSAPAMTVYNYGGYQQLLVYVRGSNGNIWGIAYHAGAWHGWVDMNNLLSPGVTNASISAPAVATYTGNGDRNEIHIFYISYGIGNLKELIFNPVQGPAGAWTGPFNREYGPMQSAPAAVQYNNQLQLFALDSYISGQLDQWIYTPSPGGGSWGGATSVTTDYVGSAPAVTVYGSDLEVFYDMGDVAGTWESRQLAGCRDVELHKLSPSCSRVRRVAATGLVTRLADLRRSGGFELRYPPEGPGYSLHERPEW